MTPKSAAIKNPEPLARTMPVIKEKYAKKPAFAELSTVYPPKIYLKPEPGSLCPPAEYLS